MKAETEAVSEVYPSDVSDESQAPDDVDDDDDDVTCLGVRRRCLVQSDECSRALGDHRRNCRDSSRVLHCSAPEWYVNQTKLYR